MSPIVVKAYYAHVILGAELSYPQRMTTTSVAPNEAVRVLNQILKVYLSTSLKSCVVQSTLIVVTRSLRMGYGTHMSVPGPSGG
jgi:hypothetical protein